MRSRIFYLITSLLFVLSFFIADLARTVEGKPIPDYNEWQVRTLEKINNVLSKRFSVDDNIPPNNMIAEYIFKDGKIERVELLIWTEYIRKNNKTRMVNRQYKLVEGKWRLIDALVLDLCSLPVGIKIPLIARDSEFKKLFLELHKKAGIIEDVQIPYVINTEK